MFDHMQNLHLNLAFKIENKTLEHREVTLAENALTCSFSTRKSHLAIFHIEKLLAHFPQGEAICSFCAKEKTM